jgi:hypothetical protein
MGLMGKFAAKALKKEFQQASDIVKTTTYFCLFNEYKDYNGYDLEMTDILAGLVIKYLSGDDIREIYNSEIEPRKSKIGKIKDQVAKYAENSMQKDRDMREVIVYTLRVKYEFE